MNKALRAIPSLASLALSTLAVLVLSTLVASPAMAASGSQSPIVVLGGTEPLIESGWIKSVDKDLYVDGASIAPVVDSLDTYTEGRPGYDRVRDFGAAWVTKVDGCDTRNRILMRDLVTFETLGDNCTVVTGILEDPYTGESIDFRRTNYPSKGDGNSLAVQIDHIIPLKAGWDGGAHSWTRDERIEFANDPANLWASKGSENGSKGERLYGSWKPKNAAFTCQYVAQMVWLLDTYDIAVLAIDKAAMQEAMSAESCALPISEGAVVAPTEEPIAEAETEAPVVETEAPVVETEQPVEVPAEEIAYTGGDSTPALWIGGAAVAALLAGGIILILRRRASAKSTSAPAKEETPVSDD